jgi:ribosomal protein L40E
MVLFLVIASGAALILFFLEGSCVINYGNFSKEYPLNMALEAALIIAIFMFLLLKLVHAMINLPQNVYHAFIKAKNRKTTALLVKRVLHQLLIPTENVNVVAKINFGKSNLLANIFAIFVADKTNDLEEMSIFATRLSHIKETEKLGKMYLAAYYERLKNYELAMNLLLQVKNNFFHSYKESISLRNLVFRVYVKMAEEGNFSQEKTAYFNECDAALTNIQVSHIISVQAAFEAAHGGAKEKIRKMQEYAYKLDHDNVEALAYAPQIMASMTFADMNLEIIDTFHRTPHIKLIEYLVNLNTCNGMTEVFSILRKGLNKVAEVTPEAWLGLAYAAVEAKLWREAQDCIQKLEEATYEKVSKRIWQLKIEIEKRKNGISDEVFNLQEAMVKSPYIDVYICSDCKAHSPVHNQYCRNCGAIRSLSWEILNSETRRLLI